MNYFLCFTRCKVLTIIGLLCLSTSILAQPGTISIKGKADTYTSIQNAVNAAVAGDTIDVGPGEYAENVTVGKTDLKIIGEEGTQILVGSGETGISINATGVTVQGIEFGGPYTQPYTAIDWDSEPTQTYGVELKPGATDAVISDNQIRNVRTGIQVLAGAGGATITGNLIENTKGSILLRSDTEELSGNSIGDNGSEWDIVILTSIWDASPTAMTLLPDQSDLPTYGDSVMALSAANGSMTILDRRFGDNNRSHAMVKEGENPGPEDDFGLGNGLGNPRQPYGGIQHGITAAAPGGKVNVLAGSYDESVIIDKKSSLFGANEGINPNTGTRNIESVITDNGSISIIESASGVIIDGFEFTNTEGALAYEHGAILLPPRENGGTTAGAFNAFEDITIRNNWFHDLSARPILKDCFATFDGLTITNNRIEDITGTEDRSGIKIQSRCEAGSPSTGLTITGNEIYNTTYAGIIVDGIDLAVISNNVIDNVPEHGINVGASNVGNGEITILNNKISNAALPDGTAALRIKGGTYSGAVRILFNSFTDSRRGIIIESGANLPENTDIEVHDNTFSNNQLAGIVNESDSTRVNATNNWWGDDSGPSGGINDPDTELTANGNGDAVSGDIAFDPFIGNKPTSPAATVSGSFNANPGSGSISFNSDDYTTAVSLEVKAGSGGAFNLNVMRYEDPPQNTDGITGNVSSYRWVFELSGTDDPSFSADIRISLAEVPNHGISDPNNIVIYRRSAPGVGTFTALPTTYDSGNDELVVTVSGFSEFVLGSENEELGPPSVIVDGNPGWRMMSVPVSGITVANLAAQNLVQGITGLDYDEFGANLFTSYDTGEDEFSTPANGSTILEPGRGFIWYMWGPDANENVEESKTFPVTIEVTGDEPTGDVSLGTLGAGWHLIGNPFSEDIDFSQLTDGTGPLGIPGQVWDPNEGSEGSYVLTTSLDDNLSTWQGAFIELTEETDVEIPEAAKTTGGAFLKQQKSTASRVGFMLESLDKNGNPLTRDRTALLYIHENATTGWDSYDMSKLTPLSQNYATLSFVSERDNNLVLKAQHSLPQALDNSLEIPLDIQTSEGFSELDKIPFKLSWQQEYFPDDWQFVLKDNVTREEVDLTGQSTYSFNLTKAKSAATQSVGARGESLEDSERTGLASPHLGGLAPKVMKTSGEETPRFTLTILSGNTVSTEPDNELPDKFALTQNYPNPFNPSTVISYQLPVNSEVRLEVFDMLGRSVATLVDGRKKAGTHQATFDAHNLASGMYIYRLKAGNTVFTKKLTLIK